MKTKPPTTSELQRARLREDLRRDRDARYRANAAFILTSVLRAAAALLALAALAGWVDPHSLHELLQAAPKP